MPYVRLLPAIALGVTLILPTSGWCADLSDPSPKLNELGSLMFENVTVGATYAYTDTGQLSDPASGARVPITFKPQKVSEFSLKVDKPVIAQFLNLVHVGNRSAAYWDLLIQPVHLTGQISYGDTLTLHPGDTLRSDVASKIVYSVGIAYKADLGTIMRHLPWFNSNAR